MDFNPDECPLTVADIQLALKDAWPSVEPQMVTFISGTTIRSTIWHFDIEITLTTKPMYGETAGDARMDFVFRHKDPKGKNLKSVTLKSGKATQVAVVKAFVRTCRMYLNGIVAAIECASEDRPKAPEADIFNIR